MECAVIHTPWVRLFKAEREKKENKETRREKQPKWKRNTRSPVQLTQKKIIVRVFSANYLHQKKKPQKPQKLYSSSESHTPKEKITESNCNMGGL